MKNNDFLLLKKLCDECGVSGDEDNIQDLIYQELKNDFEITKDSLNNLIVKYQTDLSKPLISFVSHVDEVGFIIRDILEDGFIKFNPVGSWYRHIIPGSKVVIKNKFNQKFIGVIGSEPPHYLSKDQMNNLLSYEDFYIDLGMSSKEEVLKNNISIGDFVSPDTKTEILNDDKVVGKALDDRICVASIISALKYMKQHHLKANIVAIFSAQEEVGARGAKVASYKVDSDVSFALDVTDSFDTPTSTKDDVKIGNGVALSLIDGGTIAHKGLFNYLKSLMIKNNFNFNFDPMTIGGTDSQVINITKSGIINLTISLPIRYMHSFYSVASLKDLNTLKRLIILISKDLNYQKLNKIKEFKYQKISK